MCTEVEIRRPGMESLHATTVQELAQHLRVLVPGLHLDPTTKIDRTATHCLCPIDISESARLSGYEVVDVPWDSSEIIIQKITGAPAAGLPQ